jgi:hypothetical protein
MNMIERIGRKFTEIVAVVALARGEAEHSGLPGFRGGPGDAYWRIVALAEIERRFGKMISRAVASGKGPEGFDPNLRPPNEADIVRHNNKLGILVGRHSWTLDEAIERARTMIDSAVRGDAGRFVPRWLPAREWGGGGSNWPPAWTAPHTGTYAFGDAEHRHVFRRRETRDDEYEAPKAPVERPVDTWSVDDVRAAMRSETYWNVWDPEHEEVHRLIDRWHELFDIDGRPRRAGGKADPVPCVYAHQIGGRGPVSAHARIDLIPVRAHDRTRRRTHRWTELRRRES